MIIVLPTYHIHLFSKQELIRACIHSNFQCGLPIIFENWVLDEELLQAICYHGWVEPIQTLLSIEKISSIDSPVCSNGSNLMILAAKFGRKRLTQDLINQGAKVNFVTSRGITPLYTACIHQWEDGVKILLHHGARLDIGISPLPHVCQKGYKNICQMLLSAGANPHTAMQRGLGPLYLASLSGSGDICKMLLAHGAKVNQRTDEGWCPLLAAAGKGDYKMVDILLNHGADINQTTKSGQTALRTAAKNAHLETCRLLISRGISVNQATFKDGVTPLIYASYQGQVPVVELLLSSGANINQCTKENGRTPFSAACKKGHLAVAKLLAANGADINQSTSGKSPECPLYVSIVEEQEDIFNFLLENGAAVNAVSTPKQHTPLIAACFKAKLGMCRALLQAGADSNYCTPCGTHPLRIAMRDKNESLCQLLLEHGASANQVSEKKGHTPLFIAAKMGSLSISKILVDHGADPTKISKSCGTPLHTAVKNGHYEICKYLLAFRALPDYRPFLLRAQKYNQEQIFKLFISHLVLDRKQTLLNFSCGLLQDNGLQWLSDLLLQSKYHIKEISLKHNRNLISDVGALALLNSLKKNFSVCHIDVSQHSFSSQMVTDIGAELTPERRAQKKQFYLKDLILTDQSRILDFSSLELNDTHLDLICNTIPFNHTVRHLNLTNNKITNKGAETVLKFLKQNITRHVFFDLSNNLIKGSLFSKMGFQKNILGEIQKAAELNLENRKKIVTLILLARKSGHPLFSPTLVALDILKFILDLAQLLY